MVLPTPKRMLFLVNMLAVTLAVFYLYMTFGGPSLASLSSSLQVPSPPDIEAPETMTSSSLAELALAKVHEDARPVFGHYDPVQTNTSTWMKAYSDDTPLFRMNIPGTHDAATWNYSIETQKSLDHISKFVGIKGVNPDFFRCQDRSLIDMLNDGIRAFDLRYAYDVTNSTLVFWHGPALQSQTATVDDVLFGFYSWLDDHPSETIFLSFQHEHKKDKSSGVQQLLFNTLTSPASQRYIVQSHNLGTLGDARGRINLLRRFDLDLLPGSSTANVPGLQFSPKDWTVNGANTTLNYDSDTGAVAHIQDYYRPRTSADSSLAENIEVKYDAITAHLAYAASNQKPNDLFWGFASSTNIDQNPPKTPRKQALGDGSESGVNNKLVPFLQSMKGKRLGIVMFDFYEQPRELLPLFLSLLPPSDESNIVHNDT